MASDDKKDDALDIDVLPSSTIRSDDADAPRRFVRWKMIIPPGGLQGPTFRIPLHRTQAEETWIDVSSHDDVSFFVDLEELESSSTPSLAFESSPAPFPAPDAEEKK